jgi:hypothetical protein
VVEAPIACTWLAGPDASSRWVRTASHCAPLVQEQWRARRWRSSPGGGK